MSPIFLTEFVSYCIIRTCKNNGLVNKDLKFYKLPKNSVKAQEWIDAANNPNVKTGVGKDYRVCSIHFEPNFLIQHPHEVLYGLVPPINYRGLTEDAVPTLFLPERLKMSQKEKNPIWKFFEKSISDTSKAICKLCNRTYSLGSQEPRKQTLHGLKLHLSKIHGEEYRQVLQRQSEILKLKEINLRQTDTNITDLFSCKFDEVCIKTEEINDEDAAETSIWDAVSTEEHAFNYEENEEAEAVTIPVRKKRKYQVPPNTTKKRIKTFIEDPKINEVYRIVRKIESKRDECGVYGEYVSNKLRKFNDHLRAEVQHQINNILYQAEMGTLSYFVSKDNVSLNNV